MQLSNGGGAYGYQHLGDDIGQKVGQVLAANGYRREVQMEAVHRDLAPATIWPFNGSGAVIYAFFNGSRQNNTVSWFDARLYSQIRAAVAACIR